jgi:hypothetical protein
MASVLARREAGYAGYLSIQALEPLLGYLLGLGRFRRRSRRN